MTTEREAGLREKKESLINLEGEGQGRREKTRGRGVFGGRNREGVLGVTVWMGKGKGDLSVYEFRLCTVKDWYEAPLVWILLWQVPSFVPYGSLSPKTR